MTHKEYHENASYRISFSKNGYLLVSDSKLYCGNEVKNKVHRMKYLIKKQKFQHDPREY